MINLKLKIQKIHFFLIWNGRIRGNYLRKKKILDYIGDDVIFQSRNFPMDPKLVRIHNNVVVAANVYFVTHDAIRHILMKKNNSFYQMNIAPIEVGNNVFIGLGSIIMPNVKIGNNVIIAAGSLVNKNVPDNTIYGGIPAKKIGEFESLEKERELLSKKYDKEISYEELVKIKWEEFDKINNKK